VNGLDARAMLERPLGAYLLFGVEPWADARVPQARDTLAAARFVVSVTPFANETTRALSHVILPAGTFAETSGTYVNLEGTWQTVAGAARPVGDSRPGWKILRVLGNQLGFAGYGYQSSADVLAELRDRLESVPKLGYQSAWRAAPAPASAPPLADVPMYQVDPLVRRSAPLQRTRTAQQPAASWTGA
jgi:NADH-quinone oxidoreductase subunit G